MKSDNPPVDVVVPVYGGLEETRACLQSVLDAPVSVTFELVVIDDASPDPALSRLLDAMAGEGAIRLERHGENQGFVAAATRGLGLHPQRDVVLLNSDTRVAGDWLGRLRACALAREDIASVSPFSNNATILSYPLPGQVNPLPAGLDTVALDALFARANPGQAVDIPVSVGFCMYLRRAALAHPRKPGCELRMIVAPTVRIAEIDIIERAELGNVLRVQRAVVRLVA